LYHALIVNGAGPVGREARSELPAAGVTLRELAPLANESALLDSPKTPLANATPEVGAFGKAATPSACEPER
jgi:hypothetical protein